MARTTGPLMSLDASGTIGKALVYSNWKGQSYVRRHVVPANPNLPQQIGPRTLLAWLVGQWSIFAPAMRATWTPLAKRLAIPERNAFIGDGISRVQRGETPLELYGQPNVEEVPDQPYTTLTPGKTCVDLAPTPQELDPSWGWMFFLSPLPGQPPSMHTLRGLLRNVGPGDHILITGLDAGDWYVTAIAFNWNGLHSIPQTELKVTVL